MTICPSANPPTQQYIQAPERLFNEVWGDSTALYRNIKLCSGRKYRKTETQTCRKRAQLFSWLGEEVECSQGPLRAVGASALGA